MKIKLQSWKDLSPLSFDIHRWFTSEPSSEGLLLSVAGRYLSDADGEMMAMAVAAALAWNPGFGMVLDLRRLEYQGGDHLNFWQSVLASFDLEYQQYKVVYCCSPGNKDAVRSLLEDEQDDEGLAAIVDDPDEGIRLIVEQTTGDRD
jgi:hypothetical protein